MFLIRLLEVIWFVWAVWIDAQIVTDETVKKREKLKLIVLIWLIYAVVFVMCKRGIR